MQVMSMILDHGVPPDAVNRHKQVRDAIDAFSFFLSFSSPSATRKISFFTHFNQIKEDENLTFFPLLVFFLLYPDAADARGDARQDRLRAEAPAGRRQCEEQGESVSSSERVRVSD
jgi:hypothetical protein